MATTASLPIQTSTALKEWATVLEAMGRGEQILLIRKGGLIEPGSGFEIIDKTFVFYPTFEHQAINYLRPPYQSYFDVASRHRAPDGQVRLDLVGVAVRCVESRDASIIERLSSFHIYHQAFVSQRLKWQPEQPLVIVLVRAFRLRQPCTIPVAPHYAGCKSWVTLDAPVALAGADPVLDDAAFRQRAQDVERLVA